MFWRKRKKAEDALRAAAEIAGDQIIAPGAGKWLLIVGGVAAATAAAYVVARGRKNKRSDGQQKREAVLPPKARPKEKAAQQDGLFKSLLPKL